MICKIVVKIRRVLVINNLLILYIYLVVEMIDSTIYFLYIFVMLYATFALSSAALNAIYFGVPDDNILPLVSCCV
jgi:hypothetical protein